MNVMYKSIFPKPDADRKGLSAGEIRGVPLRDISTSRYSPYAASRPSLATPSPLRPEPCQIGSLPHNEGTIPKPSGSAGIPDEKDKMPRPTDHYTHSQFEPIASDFQGETVVCVHCKHWTGSVKTLNRKKEHLLKCPAYAAWRAAGNGQDLPPPNKYSKRDSFALNEPVEYAPAPMAVMGAFGEYAGAPASSGARNRALGMFCRLLFFAAPS